VAHSPSSIPGTVVVTGAAGFLGSHLVDSLLGHGGTVLGVDNLSTGRVSNLELARATHRLRFLRRDLRSAVALPRAGLYFHLASPASPPAYRHDPIGTLMVNGIGTQSVLEAARRADGRVVVTSTSEVYGDPLEHPQSESYWGHVNPIGERSCYDEGKRFAEALAAAYRRTYGLDVRVARIFNTYGPRMDPKDGRVVSNFIVQALRGRPLTIYGSGRQTRSFCYVTDMIAGLSALATVKTAPAPVNLGNPSEVSVRELARQVSRLVGIPLRLRSKPLPSDDPRQRCPDIRRARSLLRWRPRVSLPRGLKETIRYFREELGPT
jgi:UDP-glucuronate decarboxylase